MFLIGFSQPCKIAYDMHDSAMVVYFLSCFPRPMLGTQDVLPVLMEKLNNFPLIINRLMN